MKVAPTLDGGLRIDSEDLFDWMILEMICIDASEFPGPSLPDRLSAMMETDEDWDEYVTPDIRDLFSSQVEIVARQIQAVEKMPDQSGSIHITRDQADVWYGALNQARLAIEAQFQISELEVSFAREDLTDQQKLALMRYQFYGEVQTSLLHHLMGL